MSDDRQSRLNLLGTDGFIRYLHIQSDAFVETLI